MNIVISPTDTTTITQNYTICITIPMRTALKMKPKDKVHLRIENGELIVGKAPSTFRELAGHGRKAFQKLRGGHNYIMNEKKAWAK